MDGPSGNGDEGLRSDETSAEDYQIPVPEPALKSSLATIDEAVFIFSVEHTEEGLSFVFEWNNQSHESITGMTIDEFGGLTPEDILGEQEGAAVADNYRKCVERRATIQYEETLEHEHGEVTWHTKLIPVIEDDTVVQIIGMARDITDLVERTKHLQVVDRVLRHNIRNKLTVIREHARAVETGKTPAFTDRANKIIDSSNDLLATAEKARTITEVLLKESPVSTMHVDSLLNRIRETISERNIDATVSVDIPPSTTVFASPWLSDAVGELLQNAADHHDKTERSIEFAITADDGMIEFALVDDGPGIPAREREILTAGHPPSDLSHGGGLGMWMVYWVVYQSDGEIDVTDRSPRGSVVTLRLPRKDER